MFECLKDGYTFFVRYDTGALVATLTLKDDDIYKDVDRLDGDELEFLDKFPNIKSLLNEEVGLSIVYDNVQEKVISSLKRKNFIGEYNDEIVWNNKISDVGIDFMDALNRLENKLLDENERRNL